jgi:CHASE3 domain sensor protein
MARGAEQRRAVRRTAWILAGIAIAFYLGFILMGVLRA